MGRRLVSTVAALSFALVGCGSSSARSSSGVAGGAAPSFSLPGVREGTGDVTLASFRGRPLVLNFWASWCAPCAKEMPAFQSVYESFGRRISFVGIDGSDGRRAAIAQLDRTAVTYPTGYDPQDHVYDAYHLIGRPTTFFVAANGHILGRHAGELTAKELRQLLAKYFESN